MTDRAVTPLEAAMRRRALIREAGLPMLRCAFVEARARKLDSPLICIFSRTAGGGHCALEALGDTRDAACYALPFSDVMEVATKVPVPGLAHYLSHELRVGHFAVLCLAWDGWTIAYPDDPGPAWDAEPMSPLGGNAGLRAGWAALAPGKAN